MSRTTPDADLNNLLILPVRGTATSADPGTGGTMNTTLGKHALNYVAEKQAGGQLTGRSPGEIRRRLLAFAGQFGQRSIDKLTERWIKTWLQRIFKKVKATASRSAYLSTVRGFTSWLYRNQIIDHDPCLEIPPIKRPQSVPRALTKQAVADCIAACRDDRDRAVIMIAVHCGLRREEIARLRWRDYDERSKTLHVFGKGSKERVVTVPVELARALDAIRGHGDGPIVVRQNTSNADTSVNLRPHAIGDIVRRICEDAGVKRAAWDGVGPHSFRHTAASDVLDKTKDLRDLMAMLGHTQLSSTAVYLRVANLDNLRHAMEGRTYSGRQEAADLREAS